MAEAMAEEEEVVAGAGRDWRESIILSPSSEDDDDSDTTLEADDDDGAVAVSAGFSPSTLHDLGRVLDLTK